MTTALITGGTSGIGAAFAKALAARGDDLVLVARNADRLAEKAAELQTAYGVRVEILPADLGARDDVLRVADRLTEAAKPIDLLVNNAGFGVRTRLLSEEVEVHEQAMDVMMRAVLILSGAAGRTMRDRGQGVIINVSSSAGWLAMGSYSAIKAWVTAYTEGLANELHGTGVKVSALCPGWVRTEFHERADINTRTIPDQLWLDADDLVAEALADAEHGKVISIPSKRYGILMNLAKPLPRVLIRSISRKLSSSRH